MVSSNATAAAPEAARRRGRPRSLTRGEVARAALELVDDEGLAALSMQRLASSLGVGTMTLYGYFRSKEELLDAIVDEAVLDARIPRLKGSWRERLRQLVVGAYGMLSTHPAVVEVRLTQPVLRPEALRFGDAAMGILLEADFSPGDASKAFRLIFTYLFGYAALSPARDIVQSQEAAKGVLARLPDDAFANLRRAGPEFAEAMAGHETFEFGLDLVIDGLDLRRRRQ